MIRFIKNIFFTFSILVLNITTVYAVDENEAKSFIAKVGQEAINILKIPIEDIEQREVLFKNKITYYLVFAIYHHIINSL